MPRRPDPVTPFAWRTLLHGTFWYTGMAPLRPHLVTRARDQSPAEEHHDHEIRLLPHVRPGETGFSAPSPRTTRRAD